MMLQVKASDFRCHHVMFRMTLQVRPCNGQDNAAGEIRYIVLIKMTVQVGPRNAQDEATGET